jgi:hypothetical protein
MADMDIGAVKIYLRSKLCIAVKKGLHIRVRMNSTDEIL